MIDRKIIEKLQKLLALAGSDNENEADLALAKAETLMREHNVRIADVALDGSDATVGEQEVQIGLRAAVWELDLACGIAAAFDGTPIRLAQKDRLQFVAGKTDLVIIVDLFERLRATIRRRAADYIGRYDFGRSARSAANSYRRGMVFTIVKRLHRLREHGQSVSDAKNMFGLTGKELVAIKNTAVERRIAELYPKLKNSRIRSAACHNHAAYQQGMADGNLVSLHQSIANGGVALHIGC